jgi:Helix-turn-helix domain
VNNRLKSQPDSHSVNDLTALYEQPEHFVDAARAANFLCCSRKHLLNLARTGQVPAHPFGGGSRKSWLFRLSELAAFVLQSSGNGSKMGAGRSSETETR